jgi:ArsR family transcriptional regulator
VFTRKEGSSVYYSLTSPEIAELLAVARVILTEVIAGQAGLLADLRSPVSPAAPVE